MQTSSLITFTKRNAANWSRANILDLYNEVQNIMLLKELDCNKVFDTSTGLPYKFTTTASTYEYEITTGNGFPNNGWKVEWVKSEVTDGDYSNISVHMTEADIDGGTYAKILFDDDPAGADVYVSYYKCPTQLTSESVDISVPQRFHISTMFPGVLGLIEMQENGSSQKWDMFTNILLPRFWAESNKVGTTPGSWFNEARGY